MWLSRFLRKPVGSGQIIDAFEDLSFEAERLPELRGEPIKFGPVRVLSHRPPIFLSGIPYDEFLGMAPAFGRRYGDVKAGFIIFPTWTIETPKKAQAIRQSFLQHTKRYSRHTIRYICNTPGEAQLLEKFGQPATFLNHKFTVYSGRFLRLKSSLTQFTMPGSSMESDTSWQQVLRELPTSLIASRRKAGSRNSNACGAKRRRAVPRMSC